MYRFGLFRNVWDNALQVALHGQIPSGTANEILEESHRIKLLIFAERFIRLPAIPKHLWGAMHSEYHTEFTSCIRSVMLCTTLLDVAWSIYACIDALREKEPEHSELVEVTKATVQSVWHSMAKSARFHTAELTESDILSDWKSFVEIWDSARKLCRISPVEANPDLPLNYPLSPGGCFWSSCMCRSSPSHRMKICKGCWRALYCNTKCQRR